MLIQHAPSLTRANIHLDREDAFGLGSWARLAKRRTSSPCWARPSVASYRAPPQRGRCAPMRRALAEEAKWPLDVGLEIPTELVEVRVVAEGRGEVVERPVGTQRPVRAAQADTSARREAPACRARTGCWLCSRTSSTFDVARRLRVGLRDRV